MATLGSPIRWVGTHFTSPPCGHLRSDIQLLSSPDPKPKFTTKLRLTTPNLNVVKADSLHHYYYHKCVLDVLYFLYNFEYAPTRPRRYRHQNKSPQCCSCPPVPAPQRQETRRSRTTTCPARPGIRQGGMELGSGRMQSINHQKEKREKKAHAAPQPHGQKKHCPCGHEPWESIHHACPNQPTPTNHQMQKPQISSPPLAMPLYAKAIMTEEKDPAATVAARSRFHEPPPMKTLPPS
ncbi:hypothetical protein QBC39DRAFT_341723 [Podospora conica]|nr:hypothetical protein QBC39DRAFT_341723 [Schizothecium conicum]